MKLKQKLGLNGRKEDVICALFGVYVAAVFWITLFLRIGTYARQFLYPFRSYVALANGDASFLIENAENVLLFVPLGIFTGIIPNRSLKRSLLTGFLLSLCIECAQTIFALGTFECDDLLHNTVGALIGYLVACKLAGKAQIQINSKRILIILIAAAVGIAAAFGIKEMKHQQMVQLAALYDREDAKNLLVLNGNSGNIDGTSIYIGYLKNGTISVSGTTSIQVWKIISDIELAEGKYRVYGLDGKIALVGLGIAYYDEKSHEYETLIPDIKCNSVAMFEIEKKMKIRTYIRVFPGFDGNVIVSPVIYKEG